MIQCPRSPCQFWPIVDPFGKIPVAGRTFLRKNFFALQRITGADGQPVPHRIDVPIPGRNFSGQSGPAKAKFFGHDRHRQAGGGQSNG